MLPKFTEFGKTSLFFLESDGWFGFVSHELPLSERQEILSKLLSEDHKISSLAERHVTCPAVATRFVEDFRKWTQQIERAIRHTERTKMSNLKEYVALLSGIQKTYAASPSYSACRILRSHCSSHLPAIMEDLMVGAHSDELTGEVLALLRNEVSLSDDAVQESLDKEELMKAHEKFAKAFQKKFGVAVERLEHVGVGVFFLFDQQNHGDLITSVNGREIEDFADEHDYLLLKRGSQAEISYGDFPSPASRWLFVLSPKADDTSLGDVRVISQSDYGPVSMADFEE